MVDRAALIGDIAPCVKPTGTQEESIRKALDKALNELLLALPYEKLAGLSQSTMAELVAVVKMIDQKTCEKLSVLWEPKRKLDPELKLRVRKDLLALLLKERVRYEPLPAVLEIARQDGASISKVRSAAPLKDLKDLAKKWDKHWKAAQETRAVFEEHLVALLKGHEPLAKPAKK